MPTGLRRSFSSPASRGAKVAAQLREESRGIPLSLTAAVSTAHPGRTYALGNGTRDVVNGYVRSTESRITKTYRRRWVRSISSKVEMTFPRFIDCIPMSSPAVVNSATLFIVGR